MKNRLLKAIALSLCCIITATSCSVATGIADSKQQPAIKTYISKRPTDNVFTASVQALGVFGKVTSSDRVSGVVQGQKGNWLMSVNITPAGKGSRLQISPRYVPSKQTDFNSRDDLMKQILSLLENNLSEKLTEESSGKTNSAHMEAEDRSAVQPKKYEDSQAPIQALKSDLHSIPMTPIEIQNQLLALGYQIGTADGVMGKRTVAAIKKFQHDNNLPSTGQADFATITKLREKRQPK